MKYRKAVFVVVYAIDKKNPEYIILKRKLHWKGWEFPKGGIRKNEKISDAVRREVKEETGLDAKKIKKFNFSGRYKYDKKYSDRIGFIGQSFVLYAAEVEKGKIKLDEREHSKKQWVGFKKAIRKLTWENQKKSLKIVNDWLKNGRKIQKNNS